MVCGYNGGCSEIMFVGHHLATKVFITGYGMGMGDHRGRLMMKGGHGPTCYSSPRNRLYCDQETYVSALVKAVLVSKVPFCV